MLVVYTFVFSVVFGARWPGAQTDSKLSFAIVLFAGMIVYSVFAECVQRGPGLIISQPNFVKKVVFPLEVMPRVSLLAALFHAAVSLAVLLALIAITQFSLALDHRPAARAAAFGLPVPGAKVVPCLTWGFLRDVGQIISVVVTALMFLSPLFYPSSALPARAQWIVKVNPVAFPIEQTRELVIFRRLPDWFLLAIYTAVGLVVEGHPDLVPV